MIFDVFEKKWIIYILKYIQENLLGKCSNPENEKIISDLVQKLQLSVLPKFSEIEKRIINILFLKIFSENEECLVVFARLIESLKNMIACLEFLAIYAAKVNSLFTDEIMKKSYHELRDKYFWWQEGANRYIPSCALNRDEFIRDLAFIIEDLKKILHNNSKPFFDEIECMNCVIEQVQESIQKMKSCNLEQLLEIIFSSPDELFPDFKSKIRELYTRWSKIQNELFKFVDLEHTELVTLVDNDDNEQVEQQYGSPENLDSWRKFRLDNPRQDDNETNLKNALELVQRNIHQYQ
jgi:hypothetical protein